MSDERSVDERAMERTLAMFHLERNPENEASVRGTFAFAANRVGEARSDLNTTLRGTWLIRTVERFAGWLSDRLSRSK